MGSVLKVGLGYDAHHFAEGRPLILGGVKIPYSRGLRGHSDADALCHALADALLGAVGAGDIGQLFPDTDPQYRGISSLTLLSKVKDLLLGKGAHIVNLDATLVLEEPPVSGYFGQMREKIASALKTGVNSVSVKATRNEGMGFVGRGEGVAALAIALVAMTSTDG